MERFEPHKLGWITGKSQGNTVYDIDGVSMCICSGPHSWASGYILVTNNDNIREFLSKQTNKNI